MSSSRLRRRCWKSQQVPLGSLNSAAADWRRPGRIFFRRSLIASHVSLHNHERAFAFDRRNTLKRGDVSLENSSRQTTICLHLDERRAVDGQGPCATDPQARSGSFQQTRNTTNNEIGGGSVVPLQAKNDGDAFSPIGSGWTATATTKFYLLELFRWWTTPRRSWNYVGTYRWSSWQWTKVTARTLERAWGAVLDRRESYDYRELRRDTWRRRVLAFRSRETYAKALYDTPRKRTGKDDPAWRSDKKTCKGVAKKNKCASKVGIDGVPAVIACPVACAPSLLPPIVIGAGPTAEAREETVFEEGGDNATLPSWVGTSSKAKALGSKRRGR